MQIIKRMLARTSTHKPVLFRQAITQLIGRRGKQGKISTLAMLQIPKSSNKHLTLFVSEVDDDFDIQLLEVKLNALPTSYFSTRRILYTHINIAVAEPQAWHTHTKWMIKNLFKTQMSWYKENWSPISSSVNRMPDESPTQYHTSSLTNYPSEKAI